MNRQACFSRTNQLTLGRIEQLDTDRFACIVIADDHTAGSKIAFMGEVSCKIKSKISAVAEEQSLRFTERDRPYQAKPQMRSIGSTNPSHRIMDEILCSRRVALQYRLLKSTCLMYGSSVIPSSPFPRFAAPSRCNAPK
jgi:hypothetical protein